MRQLLIDAIGAIGAILTTVCWLPQAIKIIREKGNAGDLVADQPRIHAGGISFGWSTVSRSPMSR
jgi:hypothetical protein